jgi:hypothetical protein
MKRINQISTALIRCCVLVALTGLVMLPLHASAQAETGTAKGGAGKLIQLKPIQTVADADAVEPGDMVVMSCPKSKDSWATVVPPPGKTGAMPDTKSVMRHECPGCEHKYVTEGHGKAKTDKLVHTCKKCGSEDAFCCVMKKDKTAPTPGMEKK